MLDFNEAAARMFPQNPTTAAPATATTNPVAPAKPAPVAQAPAAAAPATAQPKSAAEVLFPTLAKPADATEAPKADAVPGDLAKPEAPEDDGAPSFNLDHPDAAAVAPVAKELGLSHAQVAKLDTLRTQLAAAELDRQSTAWAAETYRTVDPAMIRDAQRGVQMFGSAALVDLLDRSGLGNNAEVIKAFCKAIRGR